MSENVGTLRPMINEKRQMRGPHKRESSDAVVRDGLTSSSYETAVMVVEPRGQTVTETVCQRKRKSLLLQAKSH